MDQNNFNPNQAVEQNPTTVPMTDQTQANVVNNDQSMNKGVGGASQQSWQQQAAPQQDFANQQAQMSNAPMSQNTTVQTGVSSNRKLYSVLAYLGILVLVPLLANKENDPVVKFHAKQGLTLVVSAIVVSIGISMLSGMLAFLPRGIRLGMLGLTGFASTGWGIFVLVLEIMGIVSATKEETKPLPLIGKLNFFDGIVK